MQIPYIGTIWILGDFYQKEAKFIDNPFQNE